MLLREDVLLPTSQANVLRLLDQEKDGSILYTCVSESSKQNIEIRLYQAGSNEDTLMYVHCGGSEIVNGSLNPTRNVVGFTTLGTHKSRSSSVASSIGLSQNQEFVADSQLGHTQNWVFAAPGGSEPAAAAKTSPEPEERNGGAASRVLGQEVRGEYVSFIAGVHPTKWVRKFDLNRTYYQKVIFTNCSIPRNIGGQRMLENRLLLIMHRKSIGLYNILLKQDAVDAEAAGRGKQPRGEDVEVHSVLNAVTIISRAFWSQWDPVLQRLYVLIVTRKKHKDGETGSHVTTYSTSLCCEQLSETQAHQQMFVCPLQLGLSAEIFSYKSSAFLIQDMDPTVSDSHINIRFLQLADGTTCLCWQLLGDQGTKEGRGYRIAILNKDVMIQCAMPSDTESSMSLLSFCSFGNNILVYSPDSCWHVLAIDAVSSADDRLKPHCHYITKHSPWKGTTGPICQLPYPIPLQRKEADVLSTALQCFMLDQQHGKIISISLCGQGISAAFFDNKWTSLPNKIALARFAATSFKDDQRIAASFPLLQEVLLKFLSRDMLLSGDQILASTLIHMTANDVCSRFPFERKLRYLLPMAAPISPPPHHHFEFMIVRLDAKKRLGNQISRSMERGASSGQDWKTVRSAFENGYLVHYCLDAISEELETLGKTCNAEHNQEQRSQLQARLSNIYETEIVQTFNHCDEEGEEENILNCFSSHERDHSYENNMALTYEGLCDHLKQFVEEEDLVKCYARSYVIAQFRVVSHTIALFLLVTKVEDHDLPLFVPVQPEERNLLQLLNHLFSACISINFPLPRGFQTFLTCLTFRCCLTTHRTDGVDPVSFDFSDGSGSSNSLSGSLQGLSYSAEDIEDFSFEFFQLVDCSCIRLTAEFVARVLEELPNHEFFGYFVHKMLMRTKFSHSQVAEGVLQLWKHPHSTALLAEMQSKKLDELSRQPRRQDASSSRRKDPRFSEGVERPPTNFPPLDSFLSHIRIRSSSCNADVSHIEEATFQNTITTHGKDALGHIAF